MKGREIMRKTRKFIGLLICCAMVLTLLCPILAMADEGNDQPSEMITVLLGDVNGDGVVNTGDATLILKHCSDMTRITDAVLLIAADVNQDGQVNTGDATFILRAIVNNQEFITIETEIPKPTVEPTTNPTEDPTAEPTTNPTEEPTAEPTTNPTTEPTAEPTTDPTTEPTITPSEPPLESGTYFYGNTYRGADMQLIYSETMVENARPMNCFEPAEEKGTTLEMEYEMLNNTKITRTFETTGETYTYEGETFIRTVETTDWDAIPGIIIVEKTAGANFENSISLSTLNGTANSTYVGATFNRNMIVLVEDIDWNGASWSGIGGGGVNYTAMFYSYFDGMGYAVNAIKVRQTISGPTNNYLSTAGFFGKVNGGAVANLMLPNADVRLDTAQNSYATVGIVAAMAYDADFINCHTSGFAENMMSPYGCGGIVGYSQTLYDGQHQGQCTFIGCTSTASLSNSRSATAGILGKCIGPNNRIDQCWYNGTMASESTNVGGIVGWVSDSTVPVQVTNCWTAGKFLGVGRDADPSSVVCGLIGSDKGYVSNCYTTAHIYTTSANPVNGHPSFNGSAINTFYLTGRYYTSGVAVVNFDPATDEFVSIQFSGYRTTGYSQSNGGTGVQNVSDLAAVVAGTADVWSTAGTYPQLINTYGRPTED